MDGLSLTDAPKAVFFDWDGTLANSLVFLTKAHNYAKGKMGLPLFSSEHDFQPYLGMPRDALYHDIYADRGEEAKAYFEEYVHLNNKDGVHPLDGAADLLELWAQLGVPCGLVSNKRAIFLNEEIAAFGWAKYFKVIVGAGEASSDKPSSAPLLLALDRAKLNVEVADVWYIGDTEIDVACAKSAGAKCVIIRPPYEQDKDFSNFERKPDLVVNSARDFMSFLQEIPSFSKKALDCA